MSSLLHSWALTPIILFAIVGFTYPIFTKVLLPEHWQPYSISMHAFGLAFFTYPYFGVPMVLGALLVQFGVLSSNAEEIAAGMIAGEGVGGILNALLTVLGISFRFCGLLPSSGILSC